MRQRIFLLHNTRRILRFNKLYQRRCRLFDCKTTILTLFGSRLYDINIIVTLISEKPILNAEGTHDF